MSSAYKGFPPPALSTDRAGLSATERCDLKFGSKRTENFSKRTEKFEITRGADECKKGFENDLLRPVDFFLKVPSDFVLLLYAYKTFN